MTPDLVREVFAMDVFEFMVEVGEKESWCLRSWFESFRESGKEAYERWPYEPFSDWARVVTRLGFLLRKGRQRGGGGGGGGGGAGAMVVRG